MPRKLTTEGFIERSKSTWGSGTWDYSKVDYKDQFTKVTLICPAHGEFQTSPKKHLQGNNSCGQCSGQLVTTESFIRRSIDTYGEGRWLYDRVDYKDAHTQVEIGCSIHGTYFHQIPNNHINSIGCRECSLRFSRGKLNLDIIQQRADELMGEGVLDFSGAVYVNCRAPLKVRCSIHDTCFEQPPELISVGQRRCPECQSTRRSLGENTLLEFVKSLGEEVQHRVRSALSDSKQELDIFIPSKRVAIEFNGLYYHSEQFIHKNYHQDKRVLAESNGIRLLQIWEDDWRLRPDIVKSHIKSVLGVDSTPRMSARDTYVAHVSSDEAKLFLERTHLQGFVGSSYYLGLYYDTQLVALGSFKRRGRDFELTRFATAVRVRGGHSKIVAAFEREFSYNKLVTFADLTFGSGDLYRKSGWVEDKYLYPDYFYTRGRNRYHKFNLRLKRFKEDPSLEFEEGMTERELAVLNGFLRVYDAGKLRFVKPHPNS